ncbi:hypothetical protein KQ944_15795 [Bacillus subtilis]|uniref:hypothetical protein n=1 Tax=Pseudochrobactrum asaccharolyticum TaxID=354351 RepID=UPI001F1B86CC|nr:hypothetical protein [Pseudochrobactrum asaccharolyticum]MCF7646692.1 hypothetical protein [Pseudochrobactrum asaccharolyticum]MCF7673098.1 hypothetical protein [Bacillus subtilis]
MIDTILGVIKSFWREYANWNKSNKDERRIVEAEAWQKMDAELTALEEVARKAYVQIFVNSAIEVAQNEESVEYPFVIKLASFPCVVPNAISNNYNKMPWKEQQRIRALFHSYLVIWQSCMNRFPDRQPDLLSVHRQFEKTAKLFALALEIKKSH